MENVEIKQYYDFYNNPIAPRTPEHAVYDTNGVTLDHKWEKYESLSADIKYLEDHIENNNLDELAPVPSPGGGG